MKGSGDLPNYFEVPVPEERPNPGWTCEERRAYILRKIIKKGDPQLVKRKPLSDAFDVSQQQISKDIKQIAKSIQQNTSSEVLETELKLGYKKVKDQLEKEGEWAEVRRTLDSYRKFLMELGKIEKQPEEKRILHEGLDKVQINFVEAEDDGD